MSNEAITWAYRQPITTGAKFVLVALADMADENHSCYPGQARLAAMTGQGQRTVRRHLAELEAEGYIARARRFDKQGHRTSDRYVLPVKDGNPTGQSDHRPDKPQAKKASGKKGQRPSVQALPAKNDSPTGQSGQVTQSEPPAYEPPDFLVGLFGGQRYVTSDPADARCTAHFGVIDPGPCRGCMIAREKAEDAFAAIRREAWQAIAECPDCDEYGRLLDPDTRLPIGDCPAHPKRRTA